MLRVLAALPVCYRAVAHAGVELPAPANLTVLRYRPHVVLRWEHAGSAIKGFEVERAAPMTGEFRRVGFVGREIRTFRDEGTRPGGSYLYRVRAVTAGDASPYSEELLVKIRWSMSR